MLRQTIQNDLVRAVKKGDEIARSTLRMVLSSIYNREIEKKSNLRKQFLDKINGKRKTEDQIVKEGELIDEEVTEVIFSEVKKRKEAISEFEKGKREDLIKKEKAEIKILEKYLPEQLSEEELRKLVKEVIEKVGATEIKDMGKIMAELMTRVKGKADGGVASKIVKELLFSKPR